MKRLVVLALELSGLSLVAACGGSGSQVPPPPTVAVSMQPASLAAIDGGQTTPVTATVSGDTGGKGVSWTVTCPVGVTSCGSMAQATSASGTRDNFQADPGASTAVSVTITATSVLDPTKSKSVPVTVNPALRSVVPGVQTESGVVGLPFSLPILSLLHGGTPPIVCEIASGTPPANLSWDATTSTLQGTPVAATTPVVIAFSCKDSASTPASLAPNLQVSIQVMAGPPRAVLKVPRDLHTATLLADGLVLIAGGLTGPNTVNAPVVATATAELYDPATNVSTQIVDMASARVTHTATVLTSGQKAGQVLIAGGDLLGTAELFDPGTRQFTATGKMASPRYGQTATLLANGTVLLAGGADSSGKAPLASAEIYDPTSGAFATTGSMSTARTSHAAALLGDGRVLIVGGSDGNASLTGGEIYDPASKSFTSTGAMLEARWGLTATSVAAGKVLVTGGFGLSGAPLSSAELYDPGTDPATGHFVAAGSMAVARGRHTATVLSDGTVLLVGGSDTLHTNAQPPVCPGSFPCTVLEPTASIEVFDATTGLFVTAGPLATGRDAHTATLLPNGTVLVAGGEVVAQGQYGGSTRCCIHYDYLTVTANVESRIGTTATLSPTSLSFGTVPIGTTTPAKTMTLSNVGTTTLTISGIAMTGANAGDFAQTHTCTSSLAAGASCNISVTFRPTASGTRTMTLSVTDDATGSPQQAALSGAGMFGRCLKYLEQCPYTGCCPGLRCVPVGLRFYCH
jgi:hypothetical protein